MSAGEERNKEEAMQRSVPLSPRMRSDGFILDAVNHFPLNRSKLASGGSRMRILMDLPVWADGRKVEISCQNILRAVSVQF